MTVSVTTVVWVTVTLLTEPPDRETLIRFYRLVRPSGPGWKPIAAAAGPVASADSLPASLLGWVLGCVCVYAALFGTTVTSPLGGLASASATSSTSVPRRISS